MLIQDFVYIDAPVDTVRRRLASGAEGWLTPLAARVASQRETPRIRIGPAGDVPLLSRMTRVTVGTAVQSGDTVVIPITWQADGLSAVVPALRADLEVARVGECESQLTLMGRYDPPLGALGRHLDRLVLHRFVQASVRSFLEGIAATLGSPAPTPTG